MFAVFLRGLNRVGACTLQIPQTFKLIIDYSRAQPKSPLSQPKRNLTWRIYNLLRYTLCKNVLFVFRVFSTTHHQLYFQRHMITTIRGIFYKDNHMRVCYTSIFFFRLHLFARFASCALVLRWQHKHLHISKIITCAQS